MWTQSLFGQCCNTENNFSNNCETFTLPVHQIYAGPEIYYIERKRAVGAKQHGWVYGGRIGFDRIRRYSLYWGADGLYAEGELHGKSAEDKRIKSNYRDASIEGRFGFTFQQKEGLHLSFTPFVGAGYIEETNNFVEPSPLIIHSKIKFSYGVAGFLFRFNWDANWSVGANLKVRYPYDIRYEVTHDKDFDDSSMLAKSEIQYRIEVPIEYLRCQHWGFSFVPFYEYRLYGKQANFPHDFIETKAKFYGATLKFSYEL